MARHCGSALALALLTACSREPVGEQCTYPGSTSDAPPSSDLAPECACVDPEYGDLLCKSPICPDLTAVFHPLDASCSSFMCGDGTWTYDEAALTCALAAARDGTEGSISWSLTPDSSYSGHEGYLHILPGRRVLRQSKEWADLGGRTSSTDLWQLRDAAYFDACLALESPCQRMHCLFAGTTGPALSRCAPAHAYTP